MLNCPDPVHETLEKSGIPEKQAEATAVAFQKAQQQSELATKNDITLLRSEIESAKTEILGEMKLTRWMLVLIIAVTVLPLLKTLL